MIREFILGLINEPSDTSIFEVFKIELCFEKFENILFAHFQKRHFQEYFSIFAL